MLPDTSQSIFGQIFFRERTIFEELKNCFLRRHYTGKKSGNDWFLFFTDNMVRTLAPPCLNLSPEELRYETCCQ